MSNQVRRPLGIPVLWQPGADWSNPGTHDSRPSLRGGAAVATPSGEEVMAVHQDYATCGTCKFFDLRRGQEEILKQRFAERLVREEQWNPDHIGAPMEHVGLCGQSNGEMATTTVAKACDAYRPKK